MSAFLPELQGGIEIENKIADHSNIFESYLAQDVFIMDIMKRLLMTGYEPNGKKVLSTEKT
jgi:hypothetical protein